MSESPTWRLIERIASLFSILTPAVAVGVILWRWHGWAALSTQQRQAIAVALAVVTLAGASLVVTGVRRRWGSEGELRQDRGRAETRLMVIGSLLLLLAGAVLLFFLLRH